jgi:hypothetical protein
MVAPANTIFANVAYQAAEKDTRRRCLILPEADDEWFRRELRAQMTGFPASGHTSPQAYAVRTVAGSRFFIRTRL